MFYKITLVLLIRLEVPSYDGRCEGANTFPTRNRLPDLDPISQTRFIRFRFFHSFP